MNLYLIHNIIPLLILISFASVKQVYTSKISKIHTYRYFQDLKANQNYAQRNKRFLQPPPPPDTDDTNENKTSTEEISEDDDSTGQFCNCSSSDPAPPIKEQLVDTVYCEKVWEYFTDGSLMVEGEINIFLKNYIHLEKVDFICKRNTKVILVNIF